MGHIQENELSPHESSKTLSEQAVGRLMKFRDDKFNPVLNTFLELQVAETRRRTPQIVDTAELAAEFVSRGGKRFRPAFVIEGYKAVGGLDEDNAIFASLSVELLHAAMLVHDDVMDNSDERRGFPTVHVHYADRDEDTKLSESKAITIGDRLIAMTSVVIANLPFPEERAKDGRRLLSQMFNEVCDGQQLDLEGNRLSIDEVDENWVMRVHEYKTARYTVEKPLLFGAALAGAEKEQMDALSNYAVPLGIAFQIQDDILGMYGDRRKVGKDVDSDLREGKKTLLIIKAVEQLREAGKYTDVDRLKGILGNPDLTEEDYLWTQDVIEETGSLDYSKQLARTLITQSKEALEDVSMSADSKDYLLGIADYMLAREY